MLCLLFVLIRGIYFIWLTANIFMQTHSQHKDVEEKEKNHLNRCQIYLLLI